MGDEPRFFDPSADVVRHVNRLPHWQQEDSTYFVTFRLGDSLPDGLLTEWRIERDAWLRWNPEPWSPKQEREYRDRFTGSIERWLDDGHGDCLLRQPSLARLVGEAFAHFDGIRYHQHAWVVMPNHVHLLFSLLDGTLLDEQIQSWKGYTARAINRHVGRVGAVWQKDYHDRILRNSEHFANCARYIRRNPGDARLRAGEFLFYESDAVRALLDGKARG